jgi:hypothetical protein
MRQLQSGFNERLDMAFRRLLKDVATGSFYDGKGGWTANDAEAHDFKDSQEAIQAALRIPRETLHLVLKFPDSRMDVSHPLNKIEAPPSPTPKSKDLIITTLLPATVQAIHLFKRMVS